ncbi:group II intron reverse transcriptase/maturase [Chitinophaga sp. 22321]|uniref:RNA-directed DNA polymerase n=1 Tax=Chitinophaga hostae TaxID=2831022 RepID=A0ABS5JCX9_9BACT|nr:group II intron reverse transcriptase/maturase [Chitinophaga hostae]MBS0032477.1 group II intron reverse transcriptase/maturase [Chitinophaga hostae]
MSKTKSFSISRRLVSLAYQQVRSNKGAGGIDGISLETFHKAYKDHLYKLWNRMSSGSYMPPPIKLKEIPKKGGGLRPLGIPTISDRIAQSIVRGLLEPGLEQVFHEDSYGYRRGKSAIQALSRARERCWNQNWVVDVDIKGYYDNIPHDLLMKAVRLHCKSGWILLYLERWLKAPLQRSDGTIEERTKGVPQGSVIGPVLANLYLHYSMDKWLEKIYRHCPFERYADDAIIHCGSMREATELKAALSERLEACGLELHPEKTHVVYCKDSNRRQRGSSKMSFDFLGYTFKPRLAQNSQRGVWFTNWLPAVSTRSMRSMNEKMGKWEVLKRTTNTLQEVAAEINPVVTGWINYYSKFYKTKLVSYMHIVNVKLASWARRKYKHLRASEMKAIRWLHGVSMRQPRLFAHWALLGSKPTI